MHILSIGTDKRVLDPDSTTTLRQSAYASALGQMTIFILGVDRHVLHRAIALHRERPFDAVTSQDAFRSGFVAWRVSRKLGIPWVAQVHTDVAAPAFRWQSWKTFLHWLSARFLLPKADRIRAVSERAARGIRPWLRDPSRLVVLPLAWRSDIPDAEPREPFVLMASRLTKEKRIGDALRAFASVRERVPGITLRIAGDGPLRKKLETLSSKLGIADSVEFMGWRDDVPALMRRASAFVLCSAFEGYGTVAAEALSAGCPVVMTDVGCAGELVVDGVSGRVVSVGNVPGLIEAILEVLTNPHRENIYVDAGRSAISELPEFDGYVSRFSALFSGLGRRKRLLIVTQTIDEDDQILGFFTEWIRRFAVRFKMVTVICQRLASSRMPPNAAIISLGKERNSNRLTQLWKFYHSIWSHRSRYAAVLVHMNPIWAVAGSIYWRISGKPVYLWYTHKSVTTRLRLALLLVNAVFTASAESFRIASPKVIVTGHGIDTQYFRPDETISRIPNSLLTVGRIAQIKNLEVLIDAASILSNRGTLGLVDVVGEPVLHQDEMYKQTLLRRIAEHNLGGRVLFPGKRRNEALVRAYCSHEIFVHTSGTGSLDKSILEAMACGMKVVSCNDAARAFVPREFLFSPDNPQSLVHAIEMARIAGPTDDMRQFVIRYHDLNRLISLLSDTIQR
jgi:glycosyltransferase involved in cell wall biosynthesis